MELNDRTEQTYSNPTGTAIGKYIGKFNKSQYLALHQELSYNEFLTLALKKPRVLRDAFQYVYDMIMEKGVETFERFRTTYTRYNFFLESECPVFGIEEPLSQIVDFVRSGACKYGTERRVLLLHGPVGSSKSTICRALKRGLERYSRTEAGATYTYKWVNLPTQADSRWPDVYTSSECLSPLRENPIKLMPEEMRAAFLKDANEALVDMTKEEERIDLYRLGVEGDLNPRCKLFLDMLMDRYEGDWEKVMDNHVRVVRMVHSETDRVGIGTFQPKDEKNQDSTELTGDMNFSKIGHYGSDSDPRAFNFDGEFEIANRGICEFIEVLKLDIAFLYDLLGVTQEHSVKPKKFSQMIVDELVVGHTNTPEFEKLKSNQFMEAIRDRTVKVDIPYITRLDDEIKVLEQSYGPGKVRQHIMPHTLEVAAWFGVLTRLQEDPDKKISLRDKAKLYNGQELPGHTEDTVKEFKDKFPTEGLSGGLSVRYVQDAIASALAKHKHYVNVFHVLSALREGLYNNTLITNAEDIKRYELCVKLANDELDEILKDEVQRALVSDAKAIERLCSKYIDNLLAFVNDEKMIHPVTKAKIDPDERLMRSIEEKAGITDNGSEDFRRSIGIFLATLSQRGKTFRWDSNPELKRALELKIFEDVRDTIKLSTLSKDSMNLDPELQEKIDALKTRLIKQFGYNEESATDVLEYVASIFARGDVSK